MKKLFLALTCVFAVTSINAQAATGAADKKPQINAEIAANPACKNIISECTKLGFVVGEFKEGNGLRKNCVRSILSGQAVTQKGKAVTVTVNAADVAACKAVVEKIKGDDRETYLAQSAKK